MFKESLFFAREGLRSFRDTGSIFSTSRWAAKALTNPLRNVTREPQKILELGPGTGSVTVKVLQDMMEGDELTICEINPRFMAALRKKLATNEDFLKHQERVRFFECAVQDLPEDRIYDMIVCALPFLNFEVPTVRSIFEKLHRLGTDETVMTYYEYIGLRDISRVVSPKDVRERRLELDRYFEKHLSKELVGRERVWLNLLPINIYTLKFSPAY